MNTTPAPDTHTFLFNNEYFSVWVEATDLADAIAQAKVRMNMALKVRATDSESWAQLVEDLPRARKVRLYITKA